MPNKPLFEMPPFTVCPNCGKESLGILSVGGNQCSKRCYECRHTVYEGLPELDKKVLYLDQNLFSALYKFEQGGRPPPGHERFISEVHRLLRRLVLNQQIIMPSSDIHLDESIVFHESEALRLAIEMLGGDASFHNVHHIELSQAIAAAEAFFEKRDPIHSSDVDGILLHDRNQWLPRLHITVNSDFSAFADEIRENRGRGHTAMQSIFDKWTDEKKPFEEVLSAELNSTVQAKTGALLQFFSNYSSSIENADPMKFLNVIGNPIFTEYKTVRSLAGKYGFEGDEADKCVLSFWSSEQAQTIPHHRVAAYFFAAIARRAANGMKRNKLTRGMLNDIRAISTYAHYVDAMFIDRECASMLAEGPLNTELKYKAKIFSFADPTNFIEYLKDIDEGTDPLVGCLAETLYG